MDANGTTVTTRSRDLLLQSITSYEAATGTDHDPKARNSGCRDQTNSIVLQGTHKAVRLLALNV